MSLREDPHPGLESRVGLTDPCMICSWTSSDLTSMKPPDAVVLAALEVGHRPLCPLTSVSVVQDTAFANLPRDFGVSAPQSTGGEEQGFGKNRPSYTKGGTIASISHLGTGTEAGQKRIFMRMQTFR